MIPGNLAARCLEPLLYSRVQELRRRPGNPRRAHLAQQFAEQVTILHGIASQRGERFAADIDAATLGWLCAWAAGLAEAKPALRLHLLETRHPRAERCMRLEDWEIAEALRRIVAPE